MAPSSGKPIRLSRHALGYMARRGFTETEVADTIRTSKWLPAPQGRLQASKEFDYKNDWNGTWYARKKVRAIFVETATEIIVVTVYTYFF